MAAKIGSLGMIFVVVGFVVLACILFLGALFLGGNNMIPVSPEQNSLHPQITCFHDHRL